MMAELEAGNIAEAKYISKEGARLFEALLVGRKYWDAPIITARICGICPVAHHLTAISAIENAFGIKPSETTLDIRKLMMWGQNIHSHALHLLLLALPDFLKFRSDIQVLKKYPKESKIALRVRKFGLKIIEVIGGRIIHPLSTCVGGFYQAPLGEKLKEIYNDSEKILDESVKVADVFLNLFYPDFPYKKNFIALTGTSDYTIFSDQVRSFEGEATPLNKFYRRIEEFNRSAEVIKHTKYTGKGYSVGALARLNINCDKLNPKAKAILEKSKIKLPSYNPFHNLLAQAIEIVHGIEESQKLLKNILKADLTKEKLNVSFKVKAGAGVGAWEVPRGTLYHYYELDNEGTITGCNIITPTAQMVEAIEYDIKEYLGGIVNQKEYIQKLRALIRSYDPCMTCSTH